MNLSYGLAKTGGTWAFDTDLGIQTDFQSNSTAVAKTPAKGEIATIDTIVTGSGYTLNPGGLPKEGILCSTTGSATGAGAQVVVTTEPGGLLIAGSSVDVTAGFMNFQNDLSIAFNSNDSKYTWASTTATGDPMPDKVTGPVTTTAITSTGGSGTGATFLVSVNNGSVSKVTVSAAGSGYEIGDIITLTVANLQTAMNVANDDGSGGTQFTRIQGDIKLFLTEENITGQVTYIENILIGGSGYVVGDVLTLQEVGSSQTGTAQVTVATLGIANTVITAPNNRYPRAVRVAEGTVDAPKTIEFVGMDDVNVVIGGFVSGSIFPMNFKQIVSAGSDVTLGDTTILY